MLYLVGLVLPNAVADVAGSQKLGEDITVKHSRLWIKYEKLQGFKLEDKKSSILRTLHDQKHILARSLRIPASRD